MNRRVMTGMLLAFAVLAGACVARAAYVQVTLPLKTLPEEHDYQKTLRAALGALAAKDLEVEKAEVKAVRPDDPEDLFRLWILAEQPTPITPAFLPAEVFTLAQIESQEGLLLPAEPRVCQQLAWLAAWDYAGNPYRGSRALKLRAFVLAAVDMAMLDYLYEHDPRGASRADYLGGNLIWIGYSYSVFKDVLAPEVRAAFEAGLRKLILGHLVQWGPTGQMTDMDLFAPVGLWYISRVVADPEVATAAREYSRQLFTDEHYYHPAGYFVDNGCFDTSYNGISLYFGSWAALMTDWDFADSAIEKAYRLRAHLCFPDPDGTFTGPSAMSSRTSGDPPRDQWQFRARMIASGMVAEDALYLSPVPAQAELEAVPQKIARLYNPDPAAPPPSPKAIRWAEGHWSSDLNFAYEFYPRGYYARLKELGEKRSPLLSPLYLRPGEFVRGFERAFVVARLGGAGFAIHTGPVGRPAGHGGRPYGYGGGALAVYWSPESGTVVATRRRGVQGAVFDTYDEWRSWPIHAVSGLTASGELASSSRIQAPDVVQQLGRDRGEVRAAGIMPKYTADRTATNASALAYDREFTFGRSGALTVTTRVRSDGSEKMAELYETIPVFLRETAAVEPTAIEFLAGGRAMPASETAQDGVTAVRLSRFKGAVLISFARPQTVRLAPAWKDGYQTQAECRNVLVDLLGDGERPKGITAASVAYTIAPAAAAAP